jgi:aspartate/methionine/tyrosine aminotransferase
VAGLPHWLRLRDPSRDTVLYPAISYPTYAMGATFSGARAVPVATLPDGRLDLASIDGGVAARALCLWVNTPANPSGALGDLAAEAAWGRLHGVPVLSDECYVEFTWRGPRRTILEHGSEGVLAVHSLSKRSNLAGVRAGFYAGDAELVHYLGEVRKHAGLMVPGPVQAAAVAAWGDDAHVDEQCARYLRRLERMAEVLTTAGVPASVPDGAFYLWVAAPDGDAWALTRRLASDAGVLVSPGEFYGPDGAGFVRVAVVQPDDRIELVARRLGVV